jgi:hypothetical protein
LRERGARFFRESPRTLQIAPLPFEHRKGGNSALKGLETTSAVARVSSPLGPLDGVQRRPSATSQTPAPAFLPFSFAAIPLRSAEERAALEQLEASVSDGSDLDPAARHFLVARYGSLDEAATTVPSRQRGTNSARAGLKLGRADDPLEREADAVADRVIRGTLSRSHRTLGTSAPDGALVQRKCTQCEDEDVIRRKPSAPQTSGSAGNSAPDSISAVLGASGHPLDAATRALMEPEFGRDFSGVRVHDDVAAAATAKTIGALAYGGRAHRLW